MKSIGKHNDDQFKQLVGSHFDDVLETAPFSPKSPYGFVVVWCDYIAYLEELGRDFDVNIDQTSNNWSWSAGSKELTFNLYKYLWYGLDDEHDEQQYWLMYIDVMFGYDEESNTCDYRLDIPADRVSVAGNPVFNYGGHHQVKVDLSASDMAGVVSRLNDGLTATFYLELRFIKKFANGFAYPDINTLVVAHKYCWDDRKANEIEATFRHELGHKLGMVPDGLAGSYLDVPGDHYEECGHEGPHCKAGASYNEGTGKWSGTPSCVMFGASATSNGDRNSQFCGNCKTLLRKSYLGDRMRGFANSIKKYA